MNVSIEEDRETTSDSDVGDADEDKPAEFAGQEDLSTFVNVLFSYLVEGTSGVPRVGAAVHTLTRFCHNMAKTGQVYIHMRVCMGQKIWQNIFCPLFIRVFHCAGMGSLFFY